MKVNLDVVMPLLYTLKYCIVNSYIFTFNSAFGRKKSSSTDDTV
jgi:hypothetical protein